tara:strand:- start:161 stop:757 length:597 start_codon:yes stop_codon:yes gene_type:complete
MTRSLIRTSGAEGLILSSTDVTISSGDLIFSTADKGINLGVTSNTASNTLDDYEEGTFDSTITYDTDLTDTSPDETFSHSGNIYTKIGRFVFYAIKYFDKAGTFSGTAVNVTSATIPFAAVSVTNVRPALSNFTPYYVTGSYGSTHKTSNIYPSLVHSEGSSTVSIQMHEPNGGNYMIGMRDGYNVASVYFSGAYFTG